MIRRTFMKDITGAETAAEAAERGGLDFGVGQSKLAFRHHTEEDPDSYGNGEGDVVVSTRSKMLFRQDNGMELAVVGMNYAVHSPAEILGFTDALKAEVPDLRYEQAGVFDGGRRFFITANLGTSAPIPGDDIRNRVMIHSGFGGTSTRGFPTRERLACTNVVAATIRAGAKAGTGFKVRHTTLSKARLEALINEIGALHLVYQQDDEFNQALSRRQVRGDVVDAFLKALIPDPESGSNARAQSSRELIEQLLRKGKGADIAVDSRTRVGDTLYGLRQAVTEWTNHHRTARSNGGRSAAERRFESTLFGASRKLIDTADHLLETVLEKDIVPVSGESNIDAVDLMESLS